MDSTDERYQSYYLKLLKMKPNGRDVCNLLGTLLSGPREEKVGSKFKNAKLSELAPFWTARSAETRERVSLLLCNSDHLKLNDEGSQVKAIADIEKNPETLGSHLALLALFPEYVDEVKDQCRNTRKEKILSGAFQGLVRAKGKDELDFYVERLSGKKKFAGHFLQGLAAKAVCCYSDRNHRKEVAEFIQRDMAFHNRFMNHVTSITKAIAYLFWALPGDSERVLWTTVDFLKENWSALQYREQMYLREQFNFFSNQPIYGIPCKRDLDVLDRILNSSGIPRGALGYDSPEVRPLIIFD